MRLIYYFLPVASVLINMSAGTSGPDRPANMALLKFEAAPVRLFSQAPRPSDVANHCPTTQAHPNCATENEACEINTTVPLYRPCCDPCTCNNNTLTCVWDIGGQ
ncbi:hypothetical protein V8E54_002423 [Elaphomyces granulatus]